MAAWPKNPTVINTRVPRLDGLAKASGRAKYPSDEHPEGMLFGVVLYSPYAHAKILTLDISAAEKMPGVKGIVLLAKEGATLHFEGDDIAAVAAETEEQARDAARAIKIDYGILTHSVTEAQALAPGAPKVVEQGNLRKGRSIVTNKPAVGAEPAETPAEAMEKSDVTVEATYSLPVITHVCLETHGMTTRWETSDSLTAWVSTQSVMAAAGELADHFDIKTPNVKVLTEVMGGGFGSKFGAESWGKAAGELAKKTGKPVRIFLDRVQEHLAAGNRPSAGGTVKLGATKDGKLRAMVAETTGTAGRGNSGFPLPYVYAVPAHSRAHNDVFVNAGSSRAMRAPGHPQGCAIMEAAMDDLAAKLKIDPLEFRLKNLPLPEKDIKTPIWRAEAEIGAKAFGWKEKYKPRGENGDGPVKRGVGVAFHFWPAGPARDKQVTCVISPDGSVELQSATQDIGTGARTMLAIIAAEVLGLKPTDITSNIGNSTFVPGQASGGSTTSPSMCPPCLTAVTEARDQLFAKLAPALNAKVEDLELKAGHLLVKGKEAMSWKDATRKLGQMPISVVGKYENGLASAGVGGLQFAEVTVDVETGVVKLKKIVAVQDSGLIIDKQTWESQAYGGIIGSINYALFEERVMDPTTGVMLNPDMEYYKLAGISDIPEIVVIPYEPDEIKARGVMGVGEPVTVSAAAAIRNAVSNAIGVGVNTWPMTPQNVLTALASASAPKEGKA